MYLKCFGWFFRSGYISIELAALMCVRESWGGGQVKGSLVDKKKMHEEISSNLCAPLIARF